MFTRLLKKCGAWADKRPAWQMSALVMAALAAVFAIVFYVAIYSRRVVEVDWSKAPLYYYDLETDKIFVATNGGKFPPIRVPGAPPGSPPTGAIAWVFACHDCADEKDRYAAWVEIYTQETRDRIARARDQAGDNTTQPASIEESQKIVDDGILIARPDPADANWKKRFYKRSSPEAKKIMEESPKRCGDGVVPMPCFPPERDKRK